MSAVLISAAASALTTYARQFLLERKYPHDALFEEVREQLVHVCAAYSKDPLNVDFAERAARLMEGFERIAFEKSSGDTYSRAKVNAVVTASRVRRAHYAAYLAGKYAGDPNVGSKFKCWMFNAAAHSTIKARHALLSAREELQEEKLSRPLLGAFATSTLEETKVFLALADEHDPMSILTRFNRATVDALSGRQELIRFAMQRLRSIHPPDDNCHPAEISWHKDNYDRYRDERIPMRRSIAAEDGQAAEFISEKLRENSEKADQILSKRGEIWKHETSSNRALIATTLIGAGIVGTLFVSPEVREIITALLQLTGDVFAASFPSSDVLQMAGDGGIAGPQMILSQIMFGDGGIA